MSGKRKASSGKTRPRAAKPRAVRAKRFGGWWAGLCCGALLLLSPGTSLLLLLLLMPGLLGLAMGGRSHPIARAALLFGMAGSVGPLFRMISDGAAIPAALTVLREPTTVPVAWAAAAAGWLVAETAALAIAAIWVVQDGIRKREIDRGVAVIEGEWGSLP